MARLLLWRHAKARWAEPGDRDFDRTLKKSGRRDAEAMAEIMADRGYVPELALCSTAHRTRETWDMAATRFPEARVDFIDALYSTDSSGYLDIIRKHATSQSVMIIGHNPMIEDLALALAGHGQAEQLSDGFPTSGLAVLDFDGDWDQIERGRGRLVAFLTPRRLTEY